MIKLLVLSPKFKVNKDTFHREYYKIKICKDSQVPLKLKFMMKNINLLLTIKLRVSVHLTVTANIKHARFN